MEPKDYVAALCRRWVWIVATALLGASLALLATMLSPVSFRSSTALYVGMADGSTAREVGAGSSIDERIVPSLVSLAGTDTVLQPVVAALGLPGTPDDLAENLDVTVTDGTSVIEIAALGPSPRQAQRLAAAVAEELEGTAREVYRGPAGVSPLQISTIEPASLPRVQAAPNKKRDVAAGLVAGGAVMALLVGLGELFRPLVRGAGGVSRVAAVTAMDVYAADGRRRRQEVTARQRSLENLWWLLHESRAAGDGRRFVVVGDRAQELAHDLTATGDHVRQLSRAGHETREGAGPGAVQEIDVQPVTDVGQLWGQPGGFDGVIVAADSGRTSARALRSTVAAAESADVPLVGVVVDRVPPPQASLGSRVRAALRGNAHLPWLDAWGGGTAGPGAYARGVAVAALFLVGLARPLPVHTNTALLATVALCPLWIGVVSRYRGARLLAVLTGLGLLSGLLLALSASTDHRVTVGNTLGSIFLLVAAAGTVGLLLWARTIMPLATVGIAYGLGMLVTGVLRSPASDNPLKFELLLPIVIIVLALLTTRRRPVGSLVALLVLGLANILSDARSAFSFCVVAAALVLWQARPGAHAGARGRGVGLLALAGVGTGIYFAVSELLVTGALGAGLQARTSQQIAQSGSLLLGGRPEWTATVALMRQSPLGFGLGTVPNADEIAVAKAGFAVTRIPSGEHYIEHYLLNGRFELHSVVADLWAQLGPVGLVLGVAAIVTIVHCLGDALSRRAAPALACFLGVSAIWYLAFGPINSNIMDVAFALGVLLIPGAKPAAPSGSAPPSADSPPAPGLSATEGPEPRQQAETGR